MLPADDLRGHPIWRTHQCVALLVTLNVGAKAEVGDLDSSVDAKEDVVGLYVAVKDAFLVQVRDALQDLEREREEV